MLYYIIYWTNDVQVGGIKNLIHIIYCYNNNIFIYVTRNKIVYISLYCIHKSFDALKVMHDKMYWKTCCLVYITYVVLHKLLLPCITYDVQVVGIRKSFSANLYM